MSDQVNHNGRGLSWHALPNKEQNFKLQKASSGEHLKVSILKCQVNIVHENNDVRKKSWTVFLFPLVYSEGRYHCISWSCQNLSKFDTLMGDLQGRHCRGKLCKTTSPSHFLLNALASCHAYFFLKASKALKSQTSFSMKYAIWELQKYMKNWVWKILQ